MKFSSNLLMRLPLMVPAFFLGLASFVMFYVCFAETSIQVPSFVQKLCIFIMAAFLALLAISFIRIGFRDYYVAIEPGEEGVRFQGLTGTVYLRWDELKRVHESASTLSLEKSGGVTLNVSSDLTGYDEFRSIVLGKKRGVELYPPPVSPGEIIDKERI